MYGLTEMGQKQVHGSGITTHIFMLDKGNRNLLNMISYHDHLTSTCL